VRSLVHHHAFPPTCKTREEALYGGDRRSAPRSCRRDAPHGRVRRNRDRRISWNPFPYRAGVSDAVFTLFSEFFARFPYGTSSLPIDQIVFSLWRCSSPSFGLLIKQTNSCSGRTFDQFPRPRVSIHPLTTGFSPSWTCPFQIGCTSRRFDEL
jgi:hypothetical protein